MYTYVPVLTTYVETLGASHKLAGIIVVLWSSIIVTL
jgi:hypothetical protein